MPQEAERESGRGSAEPAVASPVSDQGSPSEGPRISLADVRRLWPDVLDTLAAFSRTTWSLVSHNANVIAADNGVLTLGFKTDGIRRTFGARDSHQTYVRQALMDRIGVDWRIEAIVDPSAAGEPSATRSRSAPRIPRSSAPPDSPIAPPASPNASSASPTAPLPAPATGGGSAEPSAPAAGTADTSPEAEFIPPTPGGGGPDKTSDQAPDQPADQPPEWAQQPDQGPPEENGGAHPDDENVDEADLGHDELLARELGAQVIEEIPRE